MPDLDGFETAVLMLATESLKRQAKLLAAKDRELLESRRVAEAHRQAAEMAGAKGAILASISHELRTPLQSLIGWTQILRSGLLPQEKRETALAVIERNALLQARLVDDAALAHRLSGPLSGARGGWRRESRRRGRDRRRPQRGPAPARPPTRSASAAHARDRRGPACREMA
jgi:signal transduction histidine kinase